MLTDLRYALRVLRQSPGFTVLCLATLALGIGANTALYSLANAVLWRPLPFERPEELEMIFVKAPALSRLVSGFLYGVAATDAATYATAAALLVVIGLLATYLPARRAAAVDPMVALRQE